MAAKLASSGRDGKAPVACLRATTGGNGNGRLNVDDADDDGLPQHQQIRTFNEALGDLMNKRLEGKLAAEELDGLSTSQTTTALGERRAHGEKGAGEGAQKHLTARKVNG